MQADIDSYKDSMANVMGKLKSSYSNFGEGNSDHDWCDDQMARHPSHTMYVPGCESNIDYIFHSDALVVTHLLELPDKQLLDSEVHLPNKVFPSDHLRIQA